MMLTNIEVHKFLFFNIVVYTVQEELLMVSSLAIAQF